MTKIGSIIEEDDLLNVPMSDYVVQLNAAGYEELARALEGAFLQASDGKGKERHANGKSFIRQPLLEISRMVGPGFPLGQVMKKSQEAYRMVENRASVSAIRELQGAIIYAAAAIVLLAEDM